MRRWLSIFTPCLLTLALVASACGTTETVTEYQLTADVESVLVEESVVESEAVVVPTGREALAAVEGEPHVLWFWGAH